MRIATFFILSLFLQIFSFIFGQNELTLQDAISKAVSNSLILQAQQATVEEKKWSKFQAGAWQNPTFAFGIGQKSSGSSSGLALDFDLGKSLSFPGKLPAKIASADASFRSAGEELTSLIRQTRLETFVLFYAYASAMERSSHLSERLRRMETIETYLRSRPFASPQKKAERIIVENRILLLQKDGEEFEIGKKRIWNELNARLRLTNEVPLKVDWFKKGTALDLQNLIKVASVKNPEVRQQVLEIEHLKKERLLASLDPLPDFGFSAFYRQESLGSETEKTIGGGLAISLPVFNFNTGGVRSLDARIRSESLRLEFQMQGAQTKLQSLWGAFQTSQKQIIRFPVTRLETLDASLADLDRDFQKGQVELLTYLELDAQAREIHEAVYESQNHFAETLAEILKLCAIDDIRVE